MRTFLKLACLGVACVIALVVFYPKQWEVGRYGIDPGVEVRFSVDTYWEHWEPVYYEIWKEGKQTVQRTYLTAYSADMLSSLKTARSADGSVIALWAASSPKDFFILYDVPSGESWPEPFSRRLDRNKKWLARHELLSANYPDLPLPSALIPRIPDEWTKRE